MTAETLRQSRKQVIDALDRAIEAYSVFLDPTLYDESGTVQEAVNKFRGKRGMASDWLERYLERFWGVRFSRWASERKSYEGLPAVSAYDLLTGERTFADLQHWQEAKSRHERREDAEYADKIVQLYLRLPTALSKMEGKKPTPGNLTRFAPTVEMEPIKTRDGVFVRITLNREWVGTGPVRSTTEDAIAAAIEFAHRMSAALGRESVTSTSQLERIANAERAVVAA